MNLPYSLFICFLILSSFISDSEEEASSSLSNETFFIIYIVSVLVLYLVLTIYAYLYYRFSQYELTDTGIVETKGVLFKKKSILEYKKIHTINKRQNIFQKLFKMSSLLIDSGSANTAFRAEIVIYETDLEVDHLMKEIKGYQKNEIQQEVNFEASDIKPTTPDTINLFDFSGKLKWIYSLLTTLSSIITLFILGFVGFLGYSIIRYYIEEVQVGNFWIILISVVGFWVFLNIISLIFSILRSFIAFNNFILTRNNDVIEVEYGLLQRNKNSFEVKRIKAVKIYQTFIQKLFGYAMIKLEVIGFGNDNGQIGVLIPLCEYKDINNILSKVLPEYKLIEKENEAKALLPFLTWKSLGIAILYALLFVIVIIIKIFDTEYNAFKPVLFSWLILLVVTYTSLLVSSILAKKRNGIRIENNVLYLYSGAYNSSITIINKKHLLAIEDVTTYMRKRKGIYTYKIHFYSNAAFNVSTVFFQDEELKDELVNLLTF